MPSSSTPLRQPAPPQDGNEALRQLLQDRTDRLDRGEDVALSHDEFWDDVGQDFKDLFGVDLDATEEDE